MILHPGILALLLGGMIVLVMTLYAARLGLTILRHWDFSSNSEQQLLLERKTSLISSLLRYSLGFELLSGILFLFTLEEIHPLFVGAMCATGSLNANPIGWWILPVKIILFFAASLWLQLNRFDLAIEDFPLVRIKSWALFPVTALVILDVALMLIYFLGLQPEIITSCCGSLFSATQGVAAELASLPPQQMMIVFYSLSGLLVGGLLLALVIKRQILRLITAGLAVLYLPFALAAVVSFISAYIYELPSHHCPFDMLQGHYDFIGYPLYIFLFCGVLYAIQPAWAVLFRTRPQLCRIIEGQEDRWIFRAIFCLGGFLLCSSWSLAFGHFVLFY